MDVHVLYITFSGSKQQETQNSNCSQQPFLLQVSQRCFDICGRVISQHPRMSKSVLLHIYPVQ